VRECEASWAAIGAAKVNNGGHQFGATCNTNWCLLSFAWMFNYKYAMHPNLKVHHKREEDESKKGKVIP
jgi:hypothetical protein